MDKLSLQNPVFATYVIAATVMILKAIGMSWFDLKRSERGKGLGRKALRTLEREASRLGSSASGVAGARDAVLLFSAGWRRHAWRDGYSVSVAHRPACNW